MEYVFILGIVFICFLSWNICQHCKSKLQITALLSSLFLLSSCFESGSSYSFMISDAEKIGFEKRQQQIYQVIGAVDGWSGTLSGDVVELYQYQDSASVDPSIFDSAIQPGNISGWIDRCQVANLLMLSKGRDACRHLNTLI